MNTSILTKVRKLFNCQIPSIDRHNQRAYVKSIRFLGDRWLLAKKVEKA
mgnify:FL=1